MSLAFSVLCSLIRQVICDSHLEFQRVFLCASLECFLVRRDHNSCSDLILGFSCFLRKRSLFGLPDEILELRS